MSNHYLSLPTRRAAEAEVERAVPNTEATAMLVRGLWTPIAVLRSDQEYLRARLTERGICCVDESTASACELERRPVAAAAQRVVEGWGRYPEPARTGGAS